MELDFNNVYDEYYKKVFSYFYGKKIGVDAAKDLTQETFFRVYTNIDRIRNVNSLQFWIFKIAHNVFCSMLRREKRRKENVMTMSSSDTFVLKSNEQSAEQILIRKELINSIKQQVNQFPEMMHTCFILHFYHDLKYEQISQLIGLSHNSIKTHIRRALKKIKSNREEYHEKNI